jgi:hypothetical protein
MADEYDKLRNLVSQIAERHADYLVIVRTGNSTATLVSDKTWSLGAAEMYVTHVKDEALLNKIKLDERGGGESDE